MAESHRLALDKDHYQQSPVLSFPVELPFLEEGPFPEVLPFVEGGAYLAGLPFLEESYLVETPSREEVQSNLRLALRPNLGPFLLRIRQDKI